MVFLRMFMWGRYVSGGALRWNEGRRKGRRKAVPSSFCGGVKGAGGARGGQRGVYAIKSAVGLEPLSRFCPSQEHKNTNGKYPWILISIFIKKGGWSGSAINLTIGIS